MDLYREEILEHWQNPLNFGVMKNADLVIDQVNPLCGDEVRFFFKFTKTNGEKPSYAKALEGKRIVDVSFVAKGCAISVASCSMLSEFIKKKKISFVAKITGQDVLELIGGPVSPARLKCALLALEALRQAQGKLK